MSIVRAFETVASNISCWNDPTWCSAPSEWMRQVLARFFRFGSGRACLLRPSNSDVDLFCYGKGIVDLYAQVPDGALDLRVAQEELHGSEIAGSLVDKRRLGAAQ